MSRVDARRHCAHQSAPSSMLLGPYSVLTSLQCIQRVRLCKTSETKHARSVHRTQMGESPSQSLGSVTRQDLLSDKASEDREKEAAIVYAKHQ